MLYAERRYRCGSERDFDAALEALKRQGCALLVTGDVSKNVTARATRRLLGDPRRDRKRFLAFTDASSKYIESCLPPSVRRGDDDVRIVELNGSNRATDEDAHDTDEGGKGELGYLRDELTKAVSDFDAAADGLEPAEIRVSIDSLEQLLDLNERAETVQFLRTVTALVRGVRGIEHIHLPVSDDAPIVQELSPLFDARIELRKRESLVAEQRWHVPRNDVMTAWSRL